MYNMELQRGIEMTNRVNGRHKKLTKLRKEPRAICTVSLETEKSKSSAAPSRPTKFVGL